jgi:hypothetical protein
MFLGFLLLSVVMITTPLHDNHEKTPPPNQKPEPLDLPLTFNFKLLLGVVLIDGHSFQQTLGHIVSYVPMS